MDILDDMGVSKLSAKRFFQKWTTPLNRWVFIPYIDQFQNVISVKTQKPGQHYNLHPSRRKLKKLQCVCVCVCVCTFFQLIFLCSSVQLWRFFGHWCSSAETEQECVSITYLKINYLKLLEW